MTVYEAAIQLVSQMSIVDKVRLMEYLSAAVKYDLEIEAYKYISWEQFLELTTGNLPEGTGNPNPSPDTEYRDET